ncbi:unnamed protein product, partial [Adineta steineri]
IGPLARLQTWRDKKYRENDQEYNRKDNNIDLYALESEKCLPDYNGLCPFCQK